MLVEYIHSRPSQLEDAIRAFPVALVPVGSLEWHGPHMPLGFDGVKAEAILRKIGETLNDGVIFPTMFYGAYHVMNFPFTYNHKVKHLQGQMATFFEQLYNSGFKVIVVFVGHYPSLQVKFMEELSMKMMKKHADLCMFAGPEHYLLSRFKQPGDHAATLETSLGLSLFPQWVDMDALPTDLEPAEFAKKCGVHGLDPRTNASAEKGAIWEKECIDVLVNGITRSVSEKSQAAFREIYAAYHASLKES